MPATAKVSLHIDPLERRTVTAIVERAVKVAKGLGFKLKGIEVTMDLIATHANGCPLRLNDLLHADDFNFCHDIFGIARHLDRETGKLGDCFRPRFAARQKEVA